MKAFSHWCEHLTNFYRDLRPSIQLPDGVGWLHPQESATILDLVELFFSKFYKDAEPRSLLLGINPGRFGAGVTGINFTAPNQLLHRCGIEHQLKPGSELSAEFIYDMIEAYGGTGAFYKKFFIGSISPLGFVKGGKNLNYYDSRELESCVTPFILDSMEKLLSAPVNRNKCFCIGEDKNFKFLTRLNNQHHWFGEIIPLPHPRFIMQYRRKQKDHFIQQYVQLLTSNDERI